MNIGHGKRHELAKSKLLHSAAKLFLEKGYTSTTVQQITKAAGMDASAINRTFGDKEGLLAALVAYVLNGQFKMTETFLQGMEYDGILFYAAETTLQLYIAESSEHIRELYSAAYSLPKTTEIIQNTITEKLEKVFKEHLPHLATKDFYMLEIASGGIMRGFMTIPCNMWFTMEQKVQSFLETTFLVYRVPEEKIKEAVRFVSQFDYPTLAQKTIDSMLTYLNEIE